MRSYDIINDDANPNNINLAGFKFSSVDDVIEKVAIPLKQRLQAKRKSLYIVSVHKIKK